MSTRTVKDIAEIAKEVRGDVRAALEHGTLTIPPYVRVTVRVDRRGLVPSINAYFAPATPDVTDDVNGHGTVIAIMTPSRNG
jgi:hypothetical protein